jgi:HEAT repeat protein
MSADVSRRVFWQERFARYRWPRRSAADWYERYKRAWETLENGPLHAVDRAYDSRVWATWGLIAHARDALPFALEMARSKNPEVRADATSVFEAVRDDPVAVQALLEMVEAGGDPEPVDSAIDALGRMRVREAIPALAEIVRDPAADGDTRHGAAWSLLQIVGRASRRDPVERALAWLDENEVDTRRDER